MGGKGLGRYNIIGLTLRAVLMSTVPPCSAVLPPLATFHHLSLPPRPLEVIFWDCLDRLSYHWLLGQLLARVPEHKSSCVTVQNLQIVVSCTSIQGKHTCTHAPTHPPTHTHAPTHPPTHTHIPPPHIHTHTNVKLRYLHGWKQSS